MAAELTFYGQAPLHQGTQQGALPAVDLGTEAVPVGASASTAAAVPAGAAFVVVSTDEACRIAFGASDAVVAKKAEPGLSRRLLPDSEYAFLLAGATHYSVIEA